MSRQDEKSAHSKETLEESRRVLKFGSYSFEASNLDKVFFPDSGIRKGDVLEYYLEVAETMVRHNKDRPLVMRRFPDGIEGHDFYQQDMPDYFPDWVERVKVKKEGGTVTHVLCQNRATLAYCQQRDARDGGHHPADHCTVEWFAQKEGRDERSPKRLRTGDRAGDQHTARAQRRKQQRVGDDERQQAISHQHSHQSPVAEG